MSCSFPDLNWARQALLEDGTAEVLDCDGNLHKFETHEQSKFWLLEDEFISYENMDVEDEREYEISLSKIHPPKSNVFYVKNT
ncbi:hypothetical protein QL995_00700 [Pseudoalteromonas sp. APC 3358]|uniref:hypothetical protein n=1 Tax=Pseudoalteromonas sp. APC 3358 TaxID=3035176 RepID=UPI0025B326D6|nr:hypothetical protein [Pseudoalteromonas sp. APC 3358]MDN3381194.1 hypothetical protein [Pseudoalteromonas sp. APC 3358]